MIRVTWPFGTALHGNRLFVNTPRATIAVDPHPIGAVAMSIDAPERGWTDCFLDVDFNWIMRLLRYARRQEEIPVSQSWTDEPDTAYEEPRQEEQDQGIERWMALRLMPTTRRHKCNALTLGIAQK